MKATGTAESQSRPKVFIALGALLVSLAGSLYAINGLEGTFEFACDAPWRIEPNRKADGSVEYGAIPIQISIHDAMYTRLDDILYGSDLLPGLVSISLPHSLVSLGKFQSVRIRELAPVERGPSSYDIQSLHEIEMTTGDWAWPANPGGHAHRICRRWLGENPESFRDVSTSSEWHASLWYVPQNPTPGTTLTLQIDVVLLRDQWGGVNTPIPLENLENALANSRFITLRNYVRVDLPADPLPRFDDRWLYGDFHYHAQATDNEGEAAYNYRGVVRAMGAMGLDFLFATEHASSSAQIIDADLPPYFSIPEIAHAQGDKLTEADARLTLGVLRDMDADRYAFCHDLIYSDKGANREASLKTSNLRWPQNYLSHAVVPQIFLGGEVDAIPEIATSEDFVSRGDVQIGLLYGNGLLFDLAKLCSPHHCDSPLLALLTLLEPVGDSYLVHDFQGVDSFQYYGREHLVYFPNSAALRVGNESTFVPSYTSRYGGATRRLENDLLPEFERKGVVFVAHHLNGSGNPGPNGVPWTADHMLLQAFRSPAVLGLEFWNEDARYGSRVCSHDFCRGDGDGSLYIGQELGFERHEKLTAGSSNPLEQLIISILSGFGFDLLPEEYHNIALPLEEVRRGFISGGAQGGLFALQPFALPSGLWQERSREIDHVLHHGAYDWDMMNLRGLDSASTANLAWLRPGEPRRVFMGGGSDAHGDLNYRRAGYFLGAEDANDTAIGKPRNLVFIGHPEGPIIAQDLPPVPPIEVNSARSGARIQLQASRPPTTPQPPIIKPPPSEPPVVLPPITKPPVTDPPIIEPPVIQPLPPPILEPPIIEPLPIELPPQVPPITKPPPIKDPPIKDPPIKDPPIKDPPIKDPPIKDPPIKDPPIKDPPIKDPPIKDPPIKDPPIIDPPIAGTAIRPHTQEQIIRALRSGRFCVTDGPAIRIAIDMNGNNMIDEQDVQMGDVYEFIKQAGSHGPHSEGQRLTLLTECISTPEFGQIGKIDVYVGVHPGRVTSRSVATEARVYAPFHHGTRDPDRDPDGGSFAQGSSYTSGGRLYNRLKDGYWWAENLTQQPRPSQAYVFTAVTPLDLDNYEVGKGISADRFFVRAFVSTSGDIFAQKPNRYAFSNPIWLLRSEAGTSASRVDDPHPTVGAARNSQGRVTITFEGTLQHSPSLAEPFVDLPGTASPYTVSGRKSAGFYRARQ